MKMRHLKQLGNSISISIPANETGYHGRECPECEGYFKIIFGTGLEGATDCICPYCGHRAGHDHFWTQDQIEYAQSQGIRKLQAALDKDLKEIAKQHNRRFGKPRGPFGISVKWEVGKSRLTPIHYYREKQLETEIVCTQCTLAYAIYGLFAYCPDCAVHNSLQILETNLEIVHKELALAETVEQQDLAEYLTNDALENVVSACDGFGREVCRVNAPKATDPAKAADIRFQNLSGAQKNVQTFFGFDIAACMQPDEWELLGRCFQKRHVISHKMGVIDADYVAKANDPTAVVGHKVSVTKEEVLASSDLVKRLGAHLIKELSALPDPP